MSVDTERAERWRAAAVEMLYAGRELEGGAAYLRRGLEEQAEGCARRAGDAMQRANERLALPT
jgi:hypothetical protein